MSLLDQDGVLPETQAPSLSRWLIMRWARGKLSALEVHEAAAAANSDPADPMLTELKNLALGNEHRSLTRLLKRHMKGAYPPPYVAKIPVWNETTGQQEIVDIPFQLPHETIANLPAEQANEWCATNTEIEALHQSWRTRVHVGDDARVAPVNLWGDTAPYHTGNDSVMLMLFGSMAVATRHWICCLSKKSFCQCGCKGNCTLQALMAVIVWSFTCLAGGGVSLA